jgi:hypothetical protein
MKDKIKILTRGGEMISLDEWQAIYGISGTKIGRNFSYMEPEFLKNLQMYDELIVCIPLIELLDVYRELSGKPCRVSSFNRSEEHQKRLKKLGYKAAKYSPHVVKLAGDIDLFTADEVRQAVKDLEKAKKVTGIKARIGWHTYLPEQTFVHVDVCPEYYAKGKVWHELKHPEVWEREVQW